MVSSDAASPIVHCVSSAEAPRPDASQLVEESKMLIARARELHVANIEALDACEIAAHRLAEVMRDFSAWPPLNRPG